MPEFSISCASANDIQKVGDWADEEGWNPGRSDGHAFPIADPSGFFIGRLDGEPVTSISAIRYGNDFGFVGLYLTRPAVRGRGYGLQTWRVGMKQLAGRNVGLDGVVDQQDNYRKSGFRHAWNNIRYDGVPSRVDTPLGVTLIDARTVAFDQLAAFDRRFFPAAREAFLAAWISLPDRTALVAVREGRLQGFGVLRAARGASRIGPLYASSEDIALSLVGELAATVGGQPITIDVPDLNKPSVTLMEQLAMKPSFEVARMYTGPVPDVDQSGIYAVTSLELG
ncbi:MAG: hypothetical protein QOI74_704 [Micromonosporaceae bacterium]|jgi:hypothetical protein|nr:hypothetical protein [Micromonosporaceae bacterium]MDT5038869.1 hypothetical protein [Micromonosporaceae bacterium]